MNLASVALAILTTVHFPVTTHDDAAQALVDRGLYLYYAYNGEDSAAAFAAAAQRDPQLAMAHWGEALADGPDLNTPMTAERFAAAQAAANAAVKLESGASAAERAYVDAMALRYRGTWADWARDDDAYLTAMLRIAQQTAGSAGDAAKTLAAEGLLERGGLAWDGPKLASADSQHALEVVDAVLAADPQDLMANHLCIHLYDRAADRDPARACARRLDAQTFAPEAEHLAHMPAHYWIETGDYAAAVASSERAYQLFARLRVLTGVDSGHERYLPHDVYVGYSAAMMLGDYAVAQRWSGRMSAAFDTPYDALTALRFGRFDDAFRLASGTSPAVVSVRGYAALMLGNQAQADGAAERLRRISAPGYLAELFLARLSEAGGRYDDAAVRIDRAAAEQHDSLEGELIPLLPALEARAELARRRRAYADAIAAYRSALDAYPGDPHALYGLASAFEAQGRNADAAAARVRFVAIWGRFPAPPLVP